MSNYSDFFGVGSSGGGGGSVPINSYLPFYVSGTSNPTGYDAATGLYTHPDGNFYLQTGFTLGADGYPNATSGGIDRTGLNVQSVDANFPGFPANFANSRTTTKNSTRFFSFQNLGGGSFMREYDFVSGNTGFTINTNAEITRGQSATYDIAYDTSNDVILASGRDNPGGYLNVAAYNASTGALLNEYRFDFGVFSTTQQISGLVYTDYTTPTATLIYVDRSSVYHLNVLDYSAGYGTDPTVSLNVNVNATAPFNSGQRLSSGKATGAIGFYDSTTGIITDYTVNNQTADGATTDFSSVTSWSSSDSIVGINHNLSRGIQITPYPSPYYQLGLGDVGDAVARTDTDSAQPLFIRIA